MVSQSWCPNRGLQLGFSFCFEESTFKGEILVGVVFKNVIARFAHGIH